MEDWDLQAVVGGHRITDKASNDPSSVFDELLAYFPENFRTRSGDFDEPFYPQILMNPISSQPIVTNSLTVPQDVEIKTAKLKSLQSLSDQSAAASDHVPKPKKIRKNQQNRVVQHVTEEGLLSDTWAWRKYGQKPIKGSPYPRSYYRCSSLKGCLARKQVERSCSDPKTFIITYTADHSHSEPTRRSSLAGSKRNKAKAFVGRRDLERQSSTETLPSPATEQGTMINVKKEVHDSEGGKEETILSNEVMQSLGDLEALLMDQTFLDMSPEFWPVDEFATLIDGNS